jgi:hypothetical protein
MRQLSLIGTYRLIDHSVGVEDQSAGSAALGIKLAASISGVIEVIVQSRKP